MLADHDAFESPKALVAEAYPAIRELRIMSNEHIRKNMPQKIQELTSDGKRMLHGFRLVRSNTNPERVRASRILKDLRDALDQSVFQSCLILNGKKRNNTYFPFCRSPEDFETLFAEKGRCRDIPPEMRPFLLSLEPYPTSDSHSGGNDILRALGTLSGPNKHQFTLKVTCSADMMHIYSIDKTKSKWIGEYVNDTDLIFFETEPSVTSHFGGSFSLSFDEASHLSNGPVASILGDLARIVERIVLGIEAETARIVAARS